MNRVILIGNGFDLAHGMPTSYQHFLNDFWNGVREEIRDKRDRNGNFENDFLSVKNVPPFWTEGSTFKSFKEDCDNAGSQITFKNRFIEIISEKQYLQNWVDIENEYYELLKKAIATQPEYSIDELNQDFEAIKYCLQEYLIKCENVSQKLTSGEVVSKAYSKVLIKEMSHTATNNLVDNIYSIYEKRQGKENYESDYSSLFRELNGNNTDKDKVRDYVTNESRQYKIEQKPNEILFLSFNYTHTEERYVSLDRRVRIQHDLESIFSSSIHIHGSLFETNKNPIIFGYGDELDDDYKRIEKLNKNEYLDNIKSIKYLETANYRKLLEFIESDEYQIFIFGHSCGISDRTLLNTLFEHDNCASIKPFYHKYKSKEDPEIYLDNYSDIVRNISRNFNSKVKYRDRVVNKTSCNPLIDLK